MLQTAIVICACAVIFWGSINVYPEGIRPYVETIASTLPRTGFTETINKGPHKGIKTTREMKAIYEDILADMDEISFDSNGQPFYVAGICPFYYLYLDLPIGTYSTWYVEEDSETRQLRYWELHPEKRPKYYYIPLYADSLCFTKTWEQEQDRIYGKLRFIQNIAECSFKKGRAGYIVKITAWK